MVAEQEIQIRKTLTAADFKSSTEVRWCPGCGDHAIMNAIQKAMAELNIPKEKYVVVSGIGCSSRFPYYMSTYGFHGIHGRAAAISSGVKTSNTDLCVWNITGDGDALAIGGNHFIHLIRRNIDINLVLFNNEIYGLTKGQYSPTTKLGFKTKTSPYGTIEDPFKPGGLTIGAGGRFFARSVDNNVKLTTEVMVEAANFKGTSIVEVLQNCVIFNDKTHYEITDPKNKGEKQIILRHGEPMIFGNNNEKGLILDGMNLKVVTLGEKGITKDKLLIHNAKEEMPYIHLMLANMQPPHFPVAMGVIRASEGQTYEDRLEEQLINVKKDSKIKNMNDLLNSGATWIVE